MHGISIEPEGKAGMEAFDAMVDHGDFSLLISGIHENMHRLGTLSYSSSSASSASVTVNNEGVMSRHSYSSDWLSFSDCIMSNVMSGSLVFANSGGVSVQDGGVHILNYVALLAPAIHFAHALPVPISTTLNIVREKVKIEWPRKDREVYYAKISRDNILQSIADVNPQGLWAVGKSVSSFFCICYLDLDELHI
jgi:hypothetical protein